MTRPVSNKQLLVLEVLRAHGPASVNEVAQRVMERVLCSACSGSGDGDHPRYGCTGCYGRGHPPFYYSAAYQCLKALLSAGLVSRTHMRDAFGDESQRYLYMAAGAPTSEDPLEALWNAPALETDA